MDVTPTIQHLHGRMRSIIGTDPAAGTTISEVIPARRRWRFLSIHVTLITDVTEVNRKLTFSFRDPTNYLLEMLTTTTQAASLTYAYTFSSFASLEVISSAKVLIPIPPIILPSAFRFTIAAENLQAGDNFSAPQMLVEEWIDP